MLPPLVEEAARKTGTQSNRTCEPTLPCSFESHDQFLNTGLAQPNTEVLPRQGSFDALKMNIRDIETADKCQPAVDHASLAVIAFIEARQK